jgi:hypothetical protein
MLAKVAAHAFTSGSPTADACHPDGVGIFGGVVELASIMASSLRTKL